MVPIDKLEQIKQRFEFLEAKMNDGAAGEDIAKLAKEYSELRPVVEQIGEYQTLLSDLEEAQLMLDDPDMKDLAAEELPAIKARIPEVEHALQLALCPRTLPMRVPQCWKFALEQWGRGRIVRR